MRYGLKIHLSPSNDALDTLKTTIRQVITKLKEADTSLIIAPYREEDLEKLVLAGPGGLPHSLSDIRKYLVGITPKTKGGPSYARIFIGHNKPMNQIIEDIAWWMKEKGGSMGKSSPI